MEGGVSGWGETSFSLAEVLGIGGVSVSEEDSKSVSKSWGKSFKLFVMLPFTFDLSGEDPAIGLEFGEGWELEMLARNDRPLRGGMLCLERMLEMRDLLERDGVSKLFDESMGSESESQGKLTVELVKDFTLELDNELDLGSSCERGNDELAFESSWESGSLFGTLKMLLTL